jgi:hypothetical protein
LEPYDFKSEFSACRKTTDFWSLKRSVRGQRRHACH